MIFVRFVLWTELFDDYDNVMYLDCNTITFKPFPELFEKNEFFCEVDNPNEGLINFYLSCLH